MPDVMTPQQRSRCMARIKGKNTAPEMLVRRLVHAMGYRYKLHDRKLPGTPDLVFPRLGKIIEVRGCFWHHHDCGLGYTPKNRRTFWTKKLRDNQARDLRNEAALIQRGWAVLIVWECEMADVGQLARRLAEFLN